MKNLSPETQKTKLPMARMGVKLPPLTYSYSLGMWEAKDQTGKVIARGNTEREARSAAVVYYATE